MTSRLAYTVDEACEIACAGRTSIYEAINTGVLKARKRGRKTLILRSDLEQWIESLPMIDQSSKKIPMPNRPQNTDTRHWVS